MKRTILLILVSLSTFPLTAQTFDIQDFNEKVEVAEFLFEYDLIAWWTSDSVMVADPAELAQLGEVWVCLPEGNTWRAYYGKYEAGNFRPVFLYHLDSNYHIRRVYEATDSARLNPFARALAYAVQQLAPLQDTLNLRFNQYVRQTEQNEIEVWLLPAFQPNATAIYGGEFYYRFDATGQRLLAEHTHYQGAFRGFQVGEPREIWLNYSDVDQPTLGGIFFVWYYKKYFTKINLETRTNISTVMQTDGGYTWLHVEKDLGKKSKKKKKRRSKSKS